VTFYRDIFLKLHMYLRFKPDPVLWLPLSVFILFKLKFFHISLLCFSLTDNCF
jgi:hypothetical protein